MPHEIRHTVATEAAAMGLSRDMIQAILGHKSDKTAKHYINRAKVQKATHDGMLTIQEKVAQKLHSDCENDTHMTHKSSISVPDSIKNSTGVHGKTIEIEALDGSHNVLITKEKALKIFEQLKLQL
jgi:cobalamin biosynthesis protein CbiD